jgi:heme-degrading monooxygenase HmoA
MYCYVWEYRVRPEHVDEFHSQYGPDGPWVALFRLAPGYVSTQLLQDRDDASRFLTVDSWESAADYASFRERFGREFVELDTRFEALTESETHLGDFERR